MKKILIFLFFTAQGLFAQNVFYKQYGQGQVQSGIGSYYTQQTFDGGYIMAGFIYPNNSDAQVYLVKTNAIGDTTWTKIIGGNIGFYMGTFVQQTSDSGYIVTGTYRASEIYIIKTNSIGDTLWTKHYDNGGASVVTCVQQTTDGGYAIAATANSNSGDVYLLKTDGLGDTLWTKKYGGSNNEYGNSVKQTTDGGYIIAGETWSNTAGSSDAYLIKTDANGDTLWTKKYGNTNGENAKEVIQTSDGGYAFCGGNGDIYVVKTNASGAITWQKTFGSISHDDAFSIKQKADNSYIIAGQIDHYSSAINNYVADACLLKINANGIQQWNRNFGPLLGSPSPSYGNYVSLTNDGGYIMTGMNQLDYLIKTDSLGNIIIADVNSKNINLDFVLVYPNPSKQKAVINFNNDAADKYTLNLFNNQGQLVRTIINITTNGLEIERLDLASGLYFFRLQSNKKILTGKLVFE